METDTSEPDRAIRDALLQAAGLNPQAIVPAGRPGGEKDAVEGFPKRYLLERPILADEEWVVIEPLLPQEPMQAGVMPLRAFVDAVLSVTRSGGRWTDLDASEAVRKRFARWAARSFWQHLTRELELAAVPAKLKAEFRQVAARAQRMVRSAKIPRR